MYDSPQFDEGLFARVYDGFERTALKRVCEMHETEFAAAYDMTLTPTPIQRHWDADYPGFYLHLDRGSNILAVAHLDTVVRHGQRTANFVDTAAGLVVYSGALDDRLGAYTILELLPTLGVNVDVLLTVGEESGQSTAEHFATEKEYLWMIEFDRGGTDVVMYQFEDPDTVDLVRDCGARVGQGSFSDIAFLEHLEIKGFNWGVGYQDYHGPRSHAYLEDYWMMLAHFLEFHEVNAETYLPHDMDRWGGYGRRSTTSWWLDEQDHLAITEEHEEHTPDDPDPWCELCVDESIGASLRNEIVDGEVLDDDLVSEDFSMVNRQLMGGAGWDQSYA